MPARNLIKHVPVILGVLFYCFLLVRTAWVCDDAYITFRTADNFVNGYGLTWNIAERVQSYTHPLWMFMFSGVYALTREPFFTGIFLSMGVSIAAICAYAYGVARDTVPALLGVLVLCMSKAFVDYSTSGLENPLTHLILAVFFIVYLRAKPGFRTLLILSLIAALGLLNRMDTALLYLPPLAYVYWQGPRLKGLLAIAVGFIPFVLWEVFALFYYGFLLPNTAYAKLNTGIPLGELIGQGFLYLGDSLAVDPLTLLVIAAALVVLLLRRERLGIPVAVGIVLYLAYVVRIGGDFMSGRFLAAPLFCAVIVLSVVKFSHMKVGVPAFIVVAAAALFSPYPPVLSGTDYGQDRGGALRQVGPPDAQGLFWKKPTAFMGENGVADERAFYYPFGGLLSTRGAEEVPNVAWVAKARSIRAMGKKVAVFGNVGYAGFFVGPEVHVVDSVALTDALLARLPARAKPHWRIGHFLRQMPDGYPQTLSRKVNLIKDKRLATLYDKLVLITRGELFDWERLAEIWNMNTGKYDDLVDFDYYRYPFEKSVGYAEVSEVKAEGTPWNQEGNVTFTDKGLRIDLGRVLHARLMEISLDSDDVYFIVYGNGPRKHAEQVIPENTMLTPANPPKRPLKRSAGLKIYRVDVPGEVVEMEFDELRIMPLAGDRSYSVGHVRFFK